MFVDTAAQIRGLISSFIATLTELEKDVFETLYLACRKAIPRAVCKKYKMTAMHARAVADSVAQRCAAYLRDCGITGSGDLF